MYFYKFQEILADKITTDGGTFLDVGCGQGRIIRHVAPRVHAAVGIDIAPNTSTTVQADALHLPFLSESFDSITCYSTIVIVPDSAAVISEIARVLKPNGRAVIHLTGALNLNPIYWKHWYIREKGIRTNNYSLSVGRKILRQCGLVVRESHALGVTYAPKGSERFTGFFHNHREPDLDFVLSNLPILRQFASHYFFVVSRFNPFLSGQSIQGWKSARLWRPRLPSP